MLYKVNIQYGRGGSDLTIAEFKNTADAELFINAKLVEDRRLKVNANYRLLEGFDLLKEFSAGSSSETTTTTGSSSSGGSQQRSSFQPTPFNSSPRPPGLPHNWLKDEEEDNNKK